MSKFKLTRAQEETFRNLRERIRDGEETCRYDLRTLAQEINPGLTDAEFDHGWTWCHPTADNYQHALEEFLAIVVGT
jgi:hypothetical protein